MKDFSEENDGDRTMLTEILLFVETSLRESCEGRTRRRESIKSFSKQAVRPMVEQGLPGQLKILIDKN